MQVRLIIIICLVLFNLHPIAVDAEDLTEEDTGRDGMQSYHVYDDVYLISNLKFDYGKPKIIIKSVFPQLEGQARYDDYGDIEEPLDEDVDESEFNMNHMRRPRVVNALEVFNQLVKYIIQQELTDFKNQVAQNQNYQAKIPRSIIKNNLYIDYDSAAIKSDRYHIISIRFTIQGFIAGMTHPYHYHRVLNYNLDSHTQIALSDLFVPDINYLEVLSRYTRGVLFRRFGDKQMIVNGTAPKPENFKNWNIKPNGLLITFDEYQVAPYVNGAQTVLVPFSILKRISSPRSPIAGCIRNRRQCSRNNLLTGGFIDEAANTRHRFHTPLQG